MFSWRRVAHAALAAVLALFVLGGATVANAATGITNTGFETDTVGWSAGTGTALTRVVTPVHSGTGAARLQRTATTGTAAMVHTLTGMKAGDPCSATAWVLGPSGYRASLKWIALNGSKQVVARTRTITLNGAWQQIPAVTLTMPTTFTSADLRMSVAKLPAGLAWYADDVTGSCGAPDRPPTAALTVTPTSGTAPLEVSADGAGSSDPDGGALSYRFDFGDGTVVGPQSGSVAVHTYAAGGSYTVSLTVTDGGGLTSTATSAVTVQDPLSNQAPTAVLTVSPTTGSAPLSVVADATGSADPEQGGLSYTFDFGDGVSAGPQAEPVATHLFTTEGARTVTLTVTDDAGLSATATRTVTVTGEVAPLGAPQLAGAGDIAAGVPGSSSFVNSASTGDLMRALLARYPELIPFTLGDNAYDTGSPTDYSAKYEPTWGSFKSITRPIPGNHDYTTAEAAGYFGYFFGGQVAGNEYYAYDVGPYWRAYALNCVLACDAGSAQHAWLQSDLAANPGKHYLAYVHAPRYTSGVSHGDDASMSAVWATLQAAGGELLISGHNHQYERFAEMNSTGALDPNGMRELVAGMGGRKLYAFQATPHVGSEFRDATHYGVLTLSLGPNSFDWQFLASGRCQSGYGTAAVYVACAEAQGTVLDSGSEATDSTVLLTP